MARHSGVVLQCIVQAKLCVEMCLFAIYNDCTIINFGQLSLNCVQVYRQKECVCVCVLST